MDFDPLAPLPLSTQELPGIGGRIKAEPEDFEVEEIPAYPPSGEGDFLYLWLEKRGMGAEFFEHQIAQRLEITRGEVGTAGLKDRHAVTRQMVSVPASAEDRLGNLDGDGITTLTVSRHTNKLRTGHLHGNRFRILVRDVVPDALNRLNPIVEQLRERGLPNYYGRQRFGREGQTFNVGMNMLTGDPKGRKPRAFLRKLAISAVQSAMFNWYVAQRLTDGLLWTVLAGDVMAHWPSGGKFYAQDVEAEQARFDAHDIVTTGPIFGRKTFPAEMDAGEREDAVLPVFGITPDMFDAQGKLMQGTRRHNVVFVPDLEANVEEAGVRLSFTLPAGSYATVVLQELTKSESLVEDEASPEVV